MLQALCEANVGRIVYVACDPATQARDIRLLRDMSYRFQKAQGVDMFCYTEHIETVVLMSQVKE